VLLAQTGILLFAYYHHPVFIFASALTPLFGPQQDIYLPNEKTGFIYLPQLLLWVPTQPAVTVEGNAVSRRGITSQNDMLSRW